MGYAVYRAADKFTRQFMREQSLGLVKGAPYRDVNTYTVSLGALPANEVYMVRAVRRETTASGTYDNASQGAFSQ